jgi:fructokinase
MTNKVLCPGEMLIDFVDKDKVANLEKCENFVKKAGGAPANVAVAIQKLGGQAYFAGSVGNDPFGNYLVNKINQYEVNSSLVKRDSSFTTLAFVSLSADGERDFFFSRGADKNYSVDIEQIHNENFNVLHFGSATMFMGGDLEKSCDDLIEYGVKENKIITFDPNYRDALFADNKEYFIKKSIEYASSADLIKVSEEELELITQNNDIDKGAEILLNTGCRFVILTLGAKGSIIFDKDNKIVVPTIPVKMQDATGAGDSYIGAIIAKIATSNQSKSELNIESIVEYAKFASKVGAITVQKIGALESIPFLSEVEYE